MNKEEGSYGSIILTKAKQFIKGIDYYMAKITVSWDGKVHTYKYSNGTYYEGTTEVNKIECLEGVTYRITIEFAGYTDTYSYNSNNANTYSISFGETSDYVKIDDNSWNKNIEERNKRVLKDKNSSDFFNFSCIKFICSTISFLAITILFILGGILQLIDVIITLSRQYKE